MNKRKLKAIIIEDEIFDRQLIEKIINSNYTDYVEIIDSVSSVKDAVVSISKYKPDLLFLDIELNGDRNGAFHILEQVEKDFKIIFVTAKSEQDDLLRAIKLSCIDYLIKPTKISDFEVPVKRAFDELTNNVENNHQNIEIFRHNTKVHNLQEAKISLQEGFSYRPITIKNIVRCEAEGNYTSFYLIDNSKLLINGNLKSVEDRLTEYGFCRISKSDFINLAHIQTFSRKNKSWELKIPPNKTLYISAPRRQSFLIRYNDFHLG